MTASKTVFEWSEHHLIAKSPKDNSLLSKPGGACRALYQRVDNNNLYIRLALRDQVDIDIQYIFLLNVESDKGKDVMYQIFCVPGRVNFFESKENKVKTLNPDLVKTYISLGSKDIEVKLNYRKLGLKRDVLNKTITQVIIEELGPGKVIKSDKKQFSSK